MHGNQPNPVQENPMFKQTKLVSALAVAGVALFARRPG